MPCPSAVVSSYNEGASAHRTCISCVVLFLQSRGLHSILRAAVLPTFPHRSLPSLHGRGTKKYDTGNRQPRPALNRSCCGISKKCRRNENGQDCEQPLNSHLQPLDLGAVALLYSQCLTAETAAPTGIARAAHMQASLGIRQYVSVSSEALHRTRPPIDACQTAFRPCQDHEYLAHIRERFRPDTGAPSTTTLQRHLVSLREVSRRRGRHRCGCSIPAGFLRQHNSGGPSDGGGALLQVGLCVRRRNCHPQAWRQRRRSLHPRGQCTFRVWQVAPDVTECSFTVNSWLGSQGPDVLLDAPVCDG